MSFDDQLPGVHSLPRDVVLNNFRVKTAARRVALADLEVELLPAAPLGYLWWLQHFTVGTIAAVGASTTDVRSGGRTLCTLAAIAAGISPGAATGSVVSLTSGAILTADPVLLQVAAGGPVDALVLARVVPTSLVATVVGPALTAVMQDVITPETVPAGEVWVMLGIFASLTQAVCVNQEAVARTLELELTRDGVVAARGQYAVAAAGATTRVTANMGQLPFVRRGDRVQARCLVAPGLGAVRLYYTYQRLAEQG